MIDPSKIKRSHSSDSISESFFFTVMIAASAMAHSKHLAVTGPSSFAHHIALDEFYKGIVEPVDSVIETWQGASAKLVSYDKDGFSFGFELAPLAYLIELRKIIDNNRNLFIPSTYVEVHSELDNVVTQLNSTIYKLTFLS